MPCHCVAEFTELESPPSVDLQYRICRVHVVQLSTLIRTSIMDYMHIKLLLCLLYKFDSFSDFNPASFLYSWSTTTPTPGWRMSRNADRDARNVSQHWALRSPSTSSSTYYSERQTGQGLSERFQRPPLANQVGPIAPAGIGDSYWHSTRKMWLRKVFEFALTWTSRDTWSQ